MMMMIMMMIMISLLFICSDDSSVSLNAKNYLSLDWHPKAKPKFFNEKASEEFEQHESYHGRATPKKQVRSGS